ncbi:MAG: hypothetical protein D8M26_00775 [Ignavibacteriae bacterium]|nr:hypothetical protein [Ignavibacteriota bacterium]
MEYEKFEYAKLVEAVNSLEYDEEKVKYISIEMLRCRSVIVDISSDVKKMEVDPIAITTKSAKINNMISDALKSDAQFNHEVAKEIMSIVEEKLCTPYHTFFQKADDLKRHYESCVEMQVKLFHIRQNDKTGVVKKSANGRMIWKAGEEKLLRLHAELHKEELTPEYKRDEILNHYVNEKLHRFNFVNFPMEPFSWFESDSAFSILVSELAERGAIPKENKFKTYGGHFLNNKGKDFKNLSQKKNYTDNTNNTGDYIRQILDKIEI